MASSIIFPQFFLPVKSVKLGRFTVSIDQPHQEYHDPLCADAPETIITTRDSYGGSHQEAVTKGFTSALTSLMSSGFSKRAKTKAKIATSQVKTYALGNSGRWFTEAMSLEETRKWVEKAIDQGDDIYVIVGFHTVADARIILQFELGREAAGQLALPVGLSLTAIGAIAPFGNIVDPSVAGQHQVIKGGEVQFVAPGEQVCALQYRKVCHQWLSSRRIDKVSLSKVSRWTAYDRCRDDEEGEDDIIEVEAVEMQKPGGDWEEVEASTGEILLLSCNSSRSQ